MMYVNCYCTDCIHNDGDGDCDQDYITINNDTMTAAGFYPMCEDYEEKKEASTNE